MARAPPPLIVQWRDLALLFHLTTYRSVAKWDRAKVAGGLSVALWACIVAFGRLTAYDWWTYE